MILLRKLRFKYWKKRRNSKDSPSHYTRACMLKIERKQAVRSHTMSQQKPNGGLQSTVTSLPLISLEDHYTIIRMLGSGTYGEVHLAEHKQTKTKIALKMVHKNASKYKDFKREFDYSYFLSPHHNIVNTFDVAFETKSSWVFAQEYAPRGDLFDAITPESGLNETIVKQIVKQVASALEFMHSKGLVHRDIKPENVLIFDEEFQRVKLMDFGMIRKSGTLVKKQTGCIPYTPPEICEAVHNEGYHVDPSTDVWAFAVMLFCCLTGSFPWEKADITDVHYNEFLQWQRRKSTKIPAQWKKFTPRLMRLFRKMMEGRSDRRCSIKELQKYMQDKWIKKEKTSKNDSDSGSVTNLMEDLNEMLETYGIETTIDRITKKERVHEWVLSTLP